MDIFKLNIGDLGAELTAYIQRPSREMASAETKPAVLVLPGGGYFFCSDREAEPIALAYAAEGFQTFVLRYSVGEKALNCQPLREAGEAVVLIRERANEWHVIPDQIAVCGFSAGGHLGAWVSLKGGAKPNAAILCYPAVQLAKIGAHSRIAAYLLGDGYTEQEAESVNLAGHVTPDAPPMFAWITADDALVDARGVLAYADAYAAAKRPYELHIFQNGEHGLSLAKPFTANGRADMADVRAEAWFPMSVAWLRRLFGHPKTV